MQRSDNMMISNGEGMIIYSQKYNRYGVSFISTTPNNIDSQVIGFVCGLSPEFKTVGLSVTFSGFFREFIAPEIAGQKLYFLRSIK